MLKKSASGVLASLRGSTYQSVRLTSSFAAALLDGLFEHPAGFQVLPPCVKEPCVFCKIELFNILLEFPCHPIDNEAYHLSHRFPGVL